MISTLTLFLYNMMFGGRVGEDEDEPDAPPGAAPVPIDQGPLDTCTRFALAMAIVDGFDKGIFRPKKNIDFNQDRVTTALLNDHKDIVGKWPEKFNEKVYQFRETTSDGTNYWQVILEVLRIDKYTFVEDMTGNERKATYVLVFPLDENDQRGAKHCIYANEYDEENEEVICINSDTANPRPRISLNKFGNAFYSVFCRASKMS